MAELSKIPKIPVSFKKEEIDIYNFIKGKRNASCYIKDLVEKDMKDNVKPVEVNKNITTNNNDLGFDF